MRKSIKTRKKKSTKSRTRKTKQAALYIVAICKENLVSGRPTGDWSSWIGNRADVIKTAISAKVKWEAVGNGPYLILGGELVEKIETPANYKITRLKKGGVL